jgi:alkaline phosphatase D
MKVAAASCSKIQSINPQPVWLEILEEKPDILLLLGDTIYLEHDHHTDPEALAAELHKLYATQLAEPGFSALLDDIKKRGAKILAIYDDHDFLGNNRYGGDYNPALREAARSEFIKFISPPRTGLDVYSFTKHGILDVAVLDERFYRQSPSVSYADRDAILGAAQWEWLENIVASSKAPYLLIASSTTLHTFGDESWEQYPQAFQRLVNLLKNRNGALVLSGDVHRNAVYDDSGIIELVTSAAARKGLVFGAHRKNYAVLTFDEKRVHVDLRSLKVGWRFKFDIPLSHWALP